MKKGKQALDIYLRTLSTQELSDKEKIHVLYQIARIYRKGLGDVDQNLEQAAEYFQKASRLGHSRSMYELSLLKMSGKGIQQDIYEGRALLKKAVELGNKKAKSLWEDVQNSLQFVQEPPQASQILAKSCKNVSKMKYKQFQQNLQQNVQQNRHKSNGKRKLRKNADHKRASSTESTDSSKERFNIQDNTSLSPAEICVSFIEEPLHLGLIEDYTELIHNQKDTTKDPLKERPPQKQKKRSEVEEKTPEPSLKSNKITPMTTPTSRSTTSSNIGIRSAIRTPTTSSPFSIRSSKSPANSELSRHNIISPHRNSLHYQHLSTIDSLKAEIDELRSQITRNSQLARQEVFDARNVGIKNVKRVQKKLDTMQQERDRLMINVDDLISELQLLKGENNTLKRKVLDYETDREIHAAERISLLQSITRLQTENVRLNALVESIRNSKYNQLHSDKLLEKKRGKLYNIPKRTETHVVRKALVKQLHIALMEQSIVIVNGDSYTGKTQLCLSLAHRETIQAMFHDGIVYIPKDVKFSQLCPSILANYDKIDVHGTPQDLGQFVQNHPELHILFIFDDVISMEQMKPILDASHIASNSRFLVVTNNISISEDIFVSIVSLPSNMERQFIEDLALKALQNAPKDSITKNDEDLSQLSNILPSGVLDTIISSSKTHLIEVQILFAHLSQYLPNMWNMTLTDALVLSNYREKDYSTTIFELLFSSTPFTSHRQLLGLLSVFHTVCPHIPFPLVYELSPFTTEETDTILQELENLNLLHVLEDRIYIPTKILRLSYDTIRSQAEVLTDSQTENQETNQVLQVQPSDMEVHLKILAIFKESLQSTEWSAFFHPNLYYTQYYFRFLGTHLHESQNDDLLRELLLKADWYLQKLHRFHDISSLQEDLTILPDPTYELIRGALLLSSRYVEHSPHILPQIFIHLLGNSVQLHEYISHLIHDLRPIAGGDHSSIDPEFVVPYSGMLASIFKHHTKSINCATFVHGSNTNILSVDSNCTLLWNAKSGKLLNIFSHGGNIVTSCSINGVEAVAISTFEDTIQIYAMKILGLPLLSLRFPTKFMTSYGDNNNNILFVNVENEVYKWNISSENPVQIYKVKEDVISVRLSQGWIFIFTSTHVVLYNLLTEKFTQYPLQPKSNPLNSMLTTAQQNISILGIDSEGMRAFFTEQQTHLITIQNLFFPDLHTIPEYHIEKHTKAKSNRVMENTHCKSEFGAWMLPWNTLLVTQTMKANFIKVENGQILASMPAHGRIKSALLSNDYRHLVTFMCNGEARVWDITKMKQFISLVQNK